MSDANRTLYRTGSEEDMLKSYRDMRGREKQFEISEWDAPIYFEPEKLRQCLYELKLEYRTIKSFRLVDNGSYMSDFMSSYLQSENAHDAKEIPAFLSLNSPCIIEFEDGDRVELFMQNQSVVRVGMNSIPDGETAGTTFDPNKMFKECIGATIEFIDVQVTEDFPEMAFRYRDRLKDQREYIDSIILCLDSGDALSLYSWGDTGEIDLLDFSGEIVMKKLNDII